MEEISRARLRLSESQNETSTELGASPRRQTFTSASSRLRGAEGLHNTNNPNSDIPEVPKLNRQSI